MLWRKLLVVGVCLAIGNVSYELLPWQHHWGTACEHSFFQAVALFAAWLTLKPRYPAA